MIKKILLFILTTIILVESLLPNAMGISDAMKVGKLYEHFVEHKELGDSFGQFFWKHYSSDSKHKARNEHKKLPTFESQYLAITFHVQHIKIEFEDHSGIYDLNKKEKFGYFNTYRFDYLKTLLNPPQIG